MKFVGTRRVFLGGSGETFFLPNVGPFAGNPLVPYPSLTNLSVTTYNPPAHSRTSPLQFNTVTFGQATTMNFNSASNNYAIFLQCNILQYTGSGRPNMNASGMHGFNSNGGGNGGSGGGAGGDGGSFAVQGNGGSGNDGEASGINQGGVGFGLLYNSGFTYPSGGGGGNGGSGNDGTGIGTGGAGGSGFGGAGAGGSADLNTSANGGGGGGGGGLIVAVCREIIGGINFIAIGGNGGEGDIVNGSGGGGGGGGGSVYIATMKYDGLSSFDGMEGSPGDGFAFDAQPGIVGNSIIFEITPTLQLIERGFGDSWDNL